jgi:hypothetical protein
VRCCKRPLDGTGLLYDAVAAPDSRVPVAQYFEARTQRPSVFHHGNRGLTRDRILAEAALFDAVRAELDAEPARRELPPPRPPEDVHGTAAHADGGSASWLADPAPDRITTRERALDIARLVLFAVALLFVLTLPGFALALLLPTGTMCLVCLGLAAILPATPFIACASRFPGPTCRPRFRSARPSWAALGLIAGYVARRPRAGPRVMLAATFSRSSGYREPLGLRGGVLAARAGAAWGFSACSS